MLKLRYLLKQVRELKKLYKFLIPLAFILFLTTAAPDERPNICGVNIGSSRKEAVSVLGEPDRARFSSCETEVWSYNTGALNYTQVYFFQDKMVGFYTDASVWEWEGISTGISREELEKFCSFQEEIIYRGAQKYLLDQKKVLGYAPACTQNGLLIEFHFDGDRLAGVFAVSRYAAERLRFNRGIAPEMHQIYAEQVHGRVNALRTRYGLPELQWCELLAEAAEKHSREMAVYGYFDHISPVSGMGLYERISALGAHFIAASENIAVNHPDGIFAVSGWLNSPEHRKNILNPDWTHTGIGVFDKCYTQIFAVNTPQAALSRLQCSEPILISDSAAQY